MHQIYNGSDVRHLLALRKSQGKSIGFVPTMGALHAGHLELVKTARSENSFVICSIFVNPAQFNNADDLERYPRTLASDCALLESVGCDAVFIPSAEEMYPARPDLRFDFGHLETILEGAFRPGHFNGVGLIVSKLFNIVQPDRAYFGQKDLQQTAVIGSLVRNLSYPILLRICPTVREPDGLAMSSRNVRLSSGERELAPMIFRVLDQCRVSLQEGGETETVLAAAVAEFDDQPAFRLEYLELVDADSLLPIGMPGPEGRNALCIAIYLGEVRLIDNLVF